MIVGSSALRVVVALGKELKLHVPVGSRTIPHWANFMTPLSFLSRLRATFLAAVAVASTCGLTLAQEQTSVTTPTAWYWLTDASVADVSARISLGYRLVDLEVEVGSPLRLNAAFVLNTGDYAKTFYWYVNQTTASLITLASQNNARIIDYERYVSPAGERFAAIMIRNAGGDFAASHGVHNNYTSSDVGAWIQQWPSRRITSIDPYLLGTNQRYSFTWVENTGTQQSAWWLYMNVTRGALDSLISQTGCRVIDIERHQTGGRYSAVLLPGDGKSTYQIYDATVGTVSRLIDQFASRIIDIEQHTVVFGERYTVVLRQNDNELAIRANDAMRAHVPQSASSGHLLKRIDGTFSTSAGVNEGRSFEAADLMTTAYLFTSIFRVRVGADGFGSAINVNTGLNGTCPIGTNPVQRTLRQSLEDMMGSSSTADAEAIRARCTTSYIEATAAVNGAGGIALNNVIGCFCGNAKNDSTLNDFAGLHEAVVDGTLAQYKGDFYDIMPSSLQFAIGNVNTAIALNSALAASSLSFDARNAFANGVRVVSKSGSYTCPQAFEVHKSVGASIVVPFRNGCETEFREYFIGAWVNDESSNANAANAVGAGLLALWEEVIYDAIDSWESASCSPFTTYCNAVPNSTGQVGAIGAVGSEYVGNQNFTVTASSLPTNSFALLLVSRSTGFVMNPGGSAGNLCLGGQIGRFNGSITSTGSNGNLSLPVSLMSTPTASGVPYSVQQGDTMYFQFWHRDVVGGAATSNYTNGLSATFI